MRNLVQFNTRVVEVRPLSGRVLIRQLFGWLQVCWLGGGSEAAPGVGNAQLQVACGAASSSIWVLHARLAAPLQGI